MELPPTDCVTRILHSSAVQMQCEPIPAFQPDVPLTHAAKTGDTGFPLVNFTKKKGITGYKVDISGPAKKGDGYLGEIIFVKVFGGDSGNIKEYDVVVKAAKKNDEFRKQTPVKEAYDNEIYLYTAIWPAFQKYQQEKGIKNVFVNIPKCFGVCRDEKQETVILQNLKALDFDLWDRQTPMNLSHVRIVMANYGRWHALSLALKNEKPDLFHELTKDMQDVFGRFLDVGKMIPHFKTCFTHTKRLLEEEGRHDIVKKYANFEENIEHYLTTFTDPNDPCSVILHGDCWTNNFMFKYKDEDKSTPVDMRFLDLQLSRVASPVFDLSYFLYVVSDRTILDNFDSLLKTYHTSMADFLREMGFNIEDIFPFKTLWKHWGQYAKYGLAFAPCILRISLSDTTEAPDFAKSAEEGDGLSGIFHFEIRLKEQYARRIKDIYIQFAETFL